MTETKNFSTAPANQWEALQERLEAATRASTPQWLQSIRRSGSAHFSELGFPTTDDEEWRFTNVRAIAEMTPVAAPGDPSVSAELVAELTYHGMPSRELVFVDGAYQPALSSVNASDATVKVLPLSEAIRQEEQILRQHFARYVRHDDNGFVALNTSMIADAAVVIIAPRKVVPEPIFLLFISTGKTVGAVTHPRILVVAREGSEAKVIEKYVSLGNEPHFTNAVTELVLDPEAILEHCKIQDESFSAIHVATIQAYQKAKSRLTTHSISLGAALARNNVTPVLDAEWCECTMNGLYLGRDAQLVDHHTAIHHAKPNCHSYEYYHGILDDKSQGVFNGKIFVRPDAQKTDAKQTNKNLLLSDDASVNTKPQLEIFADDVKCTHGATVGQLEPEHIFYLRARGISHERARRMLVHAFASDIVNRISIQPIRDELDGIFYERFENRKN